jgi:hypothetical protein
MFPARLHWSLYFLTLAACIIVLGTAVGSGLFMLGGMLLGANFTVAELALNGAKIAGFYSLMWAPGIAGVFTVKRVYETRRR